MNSRWPSWLQALFYHRTILENELKWNLLDCYSIFSFMCVFCRSLFVLLHFFLLTIVLSVLLLYTDSDCSCGIFKLFFWPLCCLSFFDIRILITPVVSSSFSLNATVESFFSTSTEAKMGHTSMCWVFLGFFFLLVYKR